MPFTAVRISPSLSHPVAVFPGRNDGHAVRRRALLLLLPTASAAPHAPTERLHRMGVCPERFVMGTRIIPINGTCVGAWGATAERTSLITANPHRRLIPCPSFQPRSALHVTLFDHSHKTKPTKCDQSTIPSTTALRILALGLTTKQAFSYHTGMRRIGKEADDLPNHCPTSSRC